MNVPLFYSGETGSGKSESRCLAIKMLLELSVSNPGKKGSKLVSQAPAAEVVIESLGDARTLFNPNASRFGKYTELQFTDKACLCGIKSLDYYLERNRMTVVSATSIYPSTSINTYISVTRLSTDIWASVLVPMHAPMASVMTMSTVLNSPLFADDQLMSRMRLQQRLEAVTNLASLSPISDDVIVTCLHKCFMTDTIYTSIGSSTLVAINPHKYVPSDAGSIL